MRALVLSSCLTLVCAAVGCSGTEPTRSGLEALDSGRPDASTIEQMPPTEEQSAADASVDGGRSDAGSEIADAGQTMDASTPLPLPCPTDLGARWRCQGTARVRCIDNVLQSEPCANGCVPPAGPSDAVCSCGAQTNLSRWNCLEDGDLHACKLGGWISQSCGGRSCEARPLGTSDVCKPTGGNLQPVITQLGTLCATYSPGSTCGITVRDLVTGETANWRGTTSYESASTVKAIWVSLAVQDVGIAAVQPYANPVFVNSDNSASGRVIDLISSPDRINAFMWHDLHMPDSGFCRWNTDGKIRMSSACDMQAAGGYNYLATDDAVSFLTALWSKKLLGTTKTDQVLEWMKLSPRSGYGGWLGTQLPAAARAVMHHKAGWVPPETSHEIGVVALPGAHPYAVALLLERTDGSLDAYNNKQLKMLEYASCVVFHAVVKDVADPFAACQRP